MDRNNNFNTNLAYYTMVGDGKWIVVLLEAFALSMMALFQNLIHVTPWAFVTVILAVILIPHYVSEMILNSVTTCKKCGLETPLRNILVVRQADSYTFMCNRCTHEMGKTQLSDY